MVEKMHDLTSISIFQANFVKMWSGLNILEQKNIQYKWPVFKHKSRVDPEHKICPTALNTDNTCT